jgi:crossover junction endodeoxyribonuclease RuvC
VRVLGFDPGTATTGYGVVETRRSRLHYLAHGTITTPANLFFADRLKLIYEEAQRLLVVFEPDAVAIERLFFKQNVTNGIAVAQARGVLALAAVQAGKPIGEFSPTEAKTAVTGYGKADKRQMQDMIKILLNLDAIPRPDDAADALGLAVCLAQTGIARLGRSVGSDEWR